MPFDRKTTDAGHFSVHHHRGVLVLVMIARCVRVGDARFDHLFKGLSARFLHRTVTILLFVINTYFIG